MTDIRNSVLTCCERLAAQKELVTSKRVKQEILRLALHSVADVEAQDHKIPKLISDWRMQRLANGSRCARQPELNNQTVVQADAVLQAEQYQAAASVTDNFNVYQSLQLPSKLDSRELMDLQRKVFILESELNRYKHAAIRANNKVKCLEKKNNSFKSKLKRERQEIIACLRSMLNTNVIDSYVCNI